MNSEQYYALYLDDYFCPSCTSVIKPYYGTLGEITFFIKKLRESGNCNDTVKAFQCYQKGQYDVLHTVAHIDHILIEPVRIHDEVKVVLSDLDWEYNNPFHFPYHIRADLADVSAILIEHKDRFTRCIKASLTNLKYENQFCVGSSWNTLEDGFWGHPEMLAVKNVNGDMIIGSRLYMVESYSSIKEKAIAEFRTRAINLSCFCQDVFGDG